ncbi:MAG: hypothetical protein K2P78_00155 [Gemmataceae bacterium]|nr:hypothetical protein [Gemmataceae bacterium]
MTPRVRLVVAAALFLGWIGWLSYAALSKSRGPVVSRAQAAATTQVIVAEVKAGEDGKPTQFVTVVERLTEAGPADGSEAFVTNLPSASGFTGPGKYVLLLTPDSSAVQVRAGGPLLTPYAVVGQQRSPGYEMNGVGPPVIYPDTPDVRAQVARLFK